MFKTVYDKANSAPFHKNEYKRGRRISREKPHPLIYHEISFPPVTAAAPWDFALCCDLRSYFNHSVGKAISCPQHYANIYFGLYYPCVYSEFTGVKWESVLLMWSSFIPIFFLFSVYLQ